MLQGRAEIERVGIDRKELPDWVRRLAAERGVPATPDGARALVETVGEDPAQLDQAVAQLAAAYAEEGVTAGTVALQFRGFGERRIWELCDAAFGGNAPQALRHLAAMLEAREQPLAILGGVAARLRDLIRVRALPPRTPPKEVARTAGLRFDWQARRYVQQARRFTEDELARLHECAVDADRMLKVGAQGEVVLPMLVARIAGPS
jgi:DNA polymerase-3 subunit delta